MEGGKGLIRLAVIGIVVLLLVAGGIMTGARLWPRVVTVERHVVAPIRVGQREPGLDEQLPDLADDACAGVVHLLLPDPPAPAPTPVPTASPRRHGRRHHVAPSAPAAPSAPLPPLDGVLVSADGYLVTAAARLPAAPATITAQMDDGSQPAARLVATDPVSGLALLKVDGDGLPALAFTDAGFPRIGTWGFTVASPAGRGCAVRTGIVSSDSIAEQAPLATYLRTSAEAEADGAPFLDAGGRLLGLATLRASDDPASTALLLPGPLVQSVVDYMIRNGKPPANAFGVVAADLDQMLATRLGADRQRGAVVLMVQPGSAADRAGLRAGDVVLSAGGAPVSGASELARALASDAATVPLDVSRDNAHHPITLVRAG